MLDLSAAPLSVLTHLLLEYRRSECLQQVNFGFPVHQLHSVVGRFCEPFQVNDRFSCHVLLICGYILQRGTGIPDVLKPFEWSVVCRDLKMPPTKISAEVLNCLNEVQAFFLCSTEVLLCLLSCGLEKTTEFFRFPRLCDRSVPRANFDVPVAKINRTLKSIRHNVGDTTSLRFVCFERRSIHSLYIQTFRSLISEWSVISSV